MGLASIFHRQCTTLYQPSFEYQTHDIRLNSVKTINKHPSVRQFVECLRTSSYAYGFTPCATALPPGALRASVITRRFLSCWGTLPSPPRLIFTFIPGLMINATICSCSDAYHVLPRRLTMLTAVEIFVSVELPATNLPL